MKNIDLYDLKIGDNFKEESFPEKYCVVNIGSVEGEKIIFAQEFGTSKIIRFSYSEQAYAPCIVYLSHSELEFNYVIFLIIGMVFLAIFNWFFCNT